MTQFVHLRLHTEYSLVDGLIRIPALMQTLVARDMPAVALSDQCNLFGVVKFYQAAYRYGIKPIIGVDLLISESESVGHPGRLVLLCRNQAGYKALMRLVSRMYVQGLQQGMPLMAREWLEEADTTGLICLSAGAAGNVGQALLAGRRDDALTALDGWRGIFGDRFYLELQRTGRADEEVYLQQGVELAARHGVPVVATNDVRFLRPEDYEAHEARVCIHDGHTLTDPGRPRRYTKDQYLKGSETMAQLFEDIPEALDNAVEIGKRCNLELRLGGSILPAFPVAKGATPESYLCELAKEKLVERLPQVLARDDERSRVYKERLEFELNTVVDMGFASYFLIVADFIDWARNNRIPVGPGRGSGAGSVVAYVLGITDLDPIEHDLLFERFLNPERVSMPDFDIDFCMEGRDRVIEYVAETYGRDRVSQIITFGRLAARAVVRDVGRILGHPYGFVDRIAKLIPFEPGMTLDKALEQDDELRKLYAGEDEVRALIDLARQLEGLARNPGRHAGGIVIAPAALTEFTPLYCDESATGVLTQFDKDDVEAVGLVKFDFLGLRTLTIIDRALATVNGERSSQGLKALDLARMPMDDRGTFDLLKSCGTTAVFQLESRGMRDLIRRLKPDRFDDIVALVALFRPGPLQSGMVDDFISRKHGIGDAPIDYLHPRLKTILEPTYGVILYQEQVMQIAQILAGYSLGEADLLRRAMGKKKPEEMAQQRSVFMAGAERNAVHARVATRIFDLMEKFAGYGFNKSHSAAYAVLAYQTAWLKAHYPAAFMCAVLSTDMAHTDKIVTLIDECARMGLEVEPPDVNRSEYAFTVSSESGITYGLGAIKGVGQAAVEAIIEERERAGVFESLEKICLRIDLQKANRRTLEALIRSGALDSCGPNRATLMARLPVALKMAEQGARAVAAGQNDMFGLAVAAADTMPSVEAYVEMPEWSAEERLAGEKDTLGLYLTGHPIEAYERDLAAMTSGRIADLKGDTMDSNGRGSQGAYMPGRDVSIGGLVLNLRRRGNRVTLALDDRSGRIEVMLFDEIYQHSRHIVAKDAILVIEGSLRFDDFLGDWRVTARKILDFDSAREAFARRLIISWPAADSPTDVVRQLSESLKPYRHGSCSVFIDYQNEEATARIALGESWSVRATPDLINRLQTLAGPDSVRLVYRLPSEPQH